MIFYLGTHRPNWLEKTDVPLCVSRNTLKDRKTMPRALGPWMLDSAAFTEIATHGEWTITSQQYAAEVDRIILQTGNCRMVAPQDWMCEPSMLAKTGLTVEEHQHRTVRNFEDLRYALGDIVFPVLQGWERDDYLRHWEMYERWHFPLEHEPVVGLGSVCRRWSDKEIGTIVHALQPLKLHGFGIRGEALKNLAPLLKSADSMAWSYNGRHNKHPGCTHTAKNCANCLYYALLWREERLIDIDHQQRLEIECAA